MDADETAWLRGVEQRLGVERAIDDDAKRLLLRLTKATADATGVRYLAPLTAFVVGRAAGRTEAAGKPFDLRVAAEWITQLAASWDRPREG